jgi:hypothetical protein
LIASEHRAKPRATKSEPLMGGIKPRGAVHVWNPSYWSAL